MFFVVDSVAYYLFYLYICARMNYYHGKSEDELATKLGWSELLSIMRSILAVTTSS